MIEKQPAVAPKNKGAKTERQKRLSAALRENLRKRKYQSQERQKEKADRTE
ncbi:MAG: hypothetical protein K0R76_1523 [Alphaproteobacteria bacterium]|jgi:hypothetical protein|nr:hypothetical protein [Alphaproteobacteria bacterium]